MGAWRGCASRKKVVWVFSQAWVTNRWKNHHWISMYTVSMHTATLSLEFVRFLLVWGSSYAVIERCLKEESPLAWETGHYRGICSSSGNFLGMQTGKSWKHGLGRMGFKCKVLEWTKVAEFAVPVCIIWILAQSVVWCGFLFTLKRVTYICMYAIDTS